MALLHAPFHLIFHLELRKKRKFSCVVCECSQFELLCTLPSEMYLYVDGAASCGLNRFSDDRLCFQSQYSFGLINRKVGDGGCCLLSACQNFDAVSFVFLVETSKVAAFASHTLNDHFYFNCTSFDIGIHRQCKFDTSYLTFRH